MMAFYEYSDQAEEAPLAKAVVYKQGSRVIAKRWNDNLGRWQRIAQCKYNSDCRKVFQSAFDVGGIVFIKRGDYLIYAVDESGTDRAVGLYVPDKGNIKIVGEPGTVLELMYNGQRNRVDFISHSINDSGNIDNVTISNLELDGSNIDWYDYNTSTGKYMYGEAIRFGQSSRYFTNLKLKNLKITGFRVGWGISLGYTPDTTRHENVLFENIYGSDLGRGVIWVALANYVKSTNIIGMDILGNNNAGEGMVYSQESGLFAEIEGIRGENVAVSVLNLSATLRCSVRGVKGIISDGGYLVRLVNASNIQISDINAYASVANSGYGLYITNTNTNSYHIQVNNVMVFGTWCVYVTPSSYSVYNLAINNLNSNKPANFENVSNLTIVGGRIFTGGADIQLNNCSNVLLELDYSALSKIGTVTFRKNHGTATITGDGTTTTFNIPHGLVSTPSFVMVTPKAGAPEPSSIDWDATNIILTFATAPATGTYYYAWEAKV